MKLQGFGRSTLRGTESGVEQERYTLHPNSDFDHNRPAFIYACWFSNNFFWGHCLQRPQKCLKLWMSAQLSHVPSRKLSRKAKWKCTNQIMCPTTRKLYKCPPTYAPHKKHWHHPSISHSQHRWSSSSEPSPQSLSPSHFQDEWIQTWFLHSNIVAGQYAPLGKRVAVGGEETYSNY